MWTLRQELSGRSPPNGGSHEDQATGGSSRQDLPPGYWKETDYWANKENNRQQPNQFEVKNKEEAKYLGDYLHQGGNASSNLATVLNRRGRVKKCIFEIGAVLNDIRVESIGGIRCGLTIWNMAIVPHLINNSETWTELDQDCIDELDKLQTLFLSVYWQFHWPVLAPPWHGIRNASPWPTG